MLIDFDDFALTVDMLDKVLVGEDKVGVVVGRHYPSDILSGEDPTLLLKQHVSYKFYLIILFEIAAALLPIFVH